MNPRDILLAWASRYKNCAVNHIPRDVIIDSQNGPWNGRHMRFQNGEPDGILNDVGGYNDGLKRFFKLERIANYHEVIAEMENEEQNISAPNLEEVL